MKSMTALFTVEDYNRLPEGFPAQLIEGLLVKEPAPTYDHMRFASRLHQRLVALAGPDLALLSPVDVVLDEHNVYQPDAVVIAEPPPGTSSDVGIPEIAIEVLSPSTGRRDREIKLPRLLAAGVKEVWLVDPKAETVERVTNEGTEVARGRDVVRSEAVPGFELVPDDFFSAPGS